MMEIRFKLKDEEGKRLQEIAREKGCDVCEAAKAIVEAYLDGEWYLCRMQMLKI